MQNSVALLRKVLLVDSFTCVAAGLLMLLGGQALSEPLGLAPLFLQGAGLSLLPFAAYLAHIARRPELPRTHLWIIVACNAVWVVDSVLVLATGWVEPTGLGYAFVIVQALAVLVLAELEWVFLRRAGAGPLAV
jgi:hypothetical protein